MVGDLLRDTSANAMPELRDRPVPGVLQRPLEEPRGVEDVHFDDLPHVQISFGERVVR